MAEVSEWCDHEVAPLRLCPGGRALCLPARWRAGQPCRASDTPGMRPYRPERRPLHVGL